MGLVDEIRKKMGLEPKRVKTETGNIPNEIKINRPIQEFAGYPQPIAVPITTSVVPSPGKTNIKDKRRIKFSVGFDSDLMNQDNENQLQRRQAQKQIKQALDLPELEEDAYISAFPGDFGPSVATVPDSTKPNPVGTTGTAPSPKRKKMEELFGVTTSGEHGSPKYGDVMYELKPAKKKKNLKEFVISENKKEDKRGSSADSYGKLAELLFAKHLNDGKHCDHYRSAGKTPNEMHDHHAKSMFGEQYSKHPEYKRLNEATKKAADEHREYLKKVHGIKHITRVVWTSQKGDHKSETGVDDPANKADVIVTGHDGNKSKTKKVAASVKAKQPNSQTEDTNWGNYGLKTLSAHCGKNIHDNDKLNALQEKHKKLVQKILNPKNENISESELHVRYKKYREKKQQDNEISKSSKEVSQHIAKGYAEGLKKKLKTDEDHVAHIKKVVGAAGQKTGGDLETGKTHLHHDVVSIHPSNDGNHYTNSMSFSEHVHGHLKEYHDYQIEHGGSGVSITATHKKTGKKHTVYRTQIYAGGTPETTQQRTQTTLPQFRHYESSKKSLKEEVSLVEHVQSIISDAKQILPIKYAINHPDEIARRHARGFMYHNDMMNNIMNDRSLPDRDQKHTDHYEKLMHHVRQYERRLSQLQDSKNESVDISEARGADSKGHKRPTEQGAGLTRKGVEAYRRKNPGSKLSTAVTTPPSKLKPGSKAANRRKSFCARMGGMPGPMKDEKGRPTRKAMSLRRWNCEANEVLNALVEAKKMKGEDPCWDNYEMVGTKQKNGREVPNCVPKK